MPKGKQSSGCGANTIVTFVIVCLLIAFCGRKKENKNDNYGSNSPSVTAKRTAKDDSIMGWYEKSRELEINHKEKEAIDFITKSLAKVEHSDTLLLQRASLYAKTGQKQKAKDDLYKIRNVTPQYHALANSLEPQQEAEPEKPKREPEKPKPTKRKITSYCTLCRDGSYSPTCATGRGACSHHGGVRQYNAPIYE